MDAAEAAGLVYVSDEMPGIRRVRRGRGWSYHHSDDSLVKGEERQRVEDLVIPPAWTEVWISPLPEGHIQATGRDEAGRKQYIYHPRWREARDTAKFSRMVPFGEALPGLRACAEADLQLPDLSHRKVTALAVRLLDQTLIRIGNHEYAEAGSFGLTTLRDRHVTFEGGHVRFTFVGKSGKDQDVTLEDARLAALVKACRDIPGYTLFQYFHERGKDSIDSGDVNAYLRQATGERFSAKDFRTWGGTVLAAKALRARGEAETDKQADKHVLAVTREVAAALGNTVATARAYYIHPLIAESYRAGTLLAFLKHRNAGNTPAGLEPEEAAVIALLKEAEGA